MDKTMKINEIFGPTVQGEGRFTGVPSIFVRLNSCNLRCCFGKVAGGPCSSMCDTPYTSHNPEKSEEWEIPWLAKHISDELDKIGGASGENSHIVITGGEPLLQQDQILELTKELEKIDCWNDITIETNGSIVPPSDLRECDRIFWSVSPKLSTSCCFEGTNVPEALQKAHREKRINIEALARIVRTENFQLKYVWSGPDCEKEIVDLCMQIEEYIMNHWVDTNRMDVHDLVFDNIMLMPEGTTNEQISKSSQEAVEACIRNGWKFCDRLHIRIWGDERKR